MSNAFFVEHEGDIADPGAAPTSANHDRRSRIRLAGLAKDEPRPIVVFSVDEVCRRTAECQPSQVRPLLDAFLSMINM
jgi:hypothetical protein